MEPEECWDKDDEPIHFIPDLSIILKENLDDDHPSLLQSFKPDAKDVKIECLPSDNSGADVGCWGGVNSFECSIDGQDEETESAESSDFQALVVGKYHDRKPRAKFSYVYEDKKVYVTNVSFKMSQKALWDFFGKFGEVKHCRIVLDRFGKSVGRAVVMFCDETGAKAAIGSTEDELELYGRTLRVSLYRRKVFEPMKSNGEPETQPEQTNTETFDGTDPTEGSSVDGVLIPWDGSSVDARPIRSSSNHGESASSSSTSDNSPINCLNDDMMAHIFQYLSLQERLLIERVCKRWRLLSIQFWPSIKEIQICNGMGNSRCFTDHDLKRLLQRGSSSLHSLDLSRSFGMLSDRSLNVIAKWCENLRELNLSGMNISNKGLQTLAEKCRKLEVFIVQDSQRIGEKGCVLYCRCPLLFFRLWWIFHRCKKLKQVEVKRIMGLKGQCLHVLCEDVLRLNLENCEKLMDVGIQKVHEKCPRLQELSVVNCVKLTDVAFIVIGQCRTLRSLDVSRLGPNVTTSGLMGLRHLEHLEHLTVSHCHDALNDSVLAVVSQGCRRLRSLDISNTSWVAEDQITDVGLYSLAAHCPLLSSIYLGDRPKISDSSLMSLSKLIHLKELVIKRSNRLTDSGVMCILSGCPVLQLLDLTGCVFVSDSSVSAAVSRMKEDQSRTLHLVVGETSVDASTVPTDLANLKISCYSPDDLDDMIADYGIDDEDDELNYDFSQVCTGLSSYDDFLDNDDPLAEEQWNMS